MDMCSGNLWKQIPSFALPLILTGILQLLYNAADMVVVGKFAGSTALAAVGSTASLINLFVNMFCLLGHFIFPSALFFRVALQLLLFGVHFCGDFFHHNLRGMQAFIPQLASIDLGGDALDFRLL